MGTFWCLFPGWTSLLVSLPKVSHMPSSSVSLKYHVYQVNPPFLENLYSSPPLSYRMSPKLLNQLFKAHHSLPQFIFPNWLIQFPQTFLNTHILSAQAKWTPNFFSMHFPHTHLQAFAVMISLPATELRSSSCYWPSLSNFSNPVLAWR